MTNARYRMTILAFCVVRDNYALLSIDFTRLFLANIKCAFSCLVARQRPIKFSTLKNNQNHQYFIVNCEALESVMGDVIKISLHKNTYKKEGCSVKWKRKPAARY